MTQGELVHYAIIVAGFFQFILPLRDLVYRKRDPNGGLIKWYKRITFLGYVLTATGILTMVLSFLDSPQKKKPLINVSRGPIFFNEGEDSISMEIEIKNFGDANARNLTSKFVEVNRFEDKLMHMLETGFKPGDTYFLAPGGIYTYIIKRPKLLLDNRITTFIYFRICYNDDNGEPQIDTVRQVYKLPFLKVGNLIFDASTTDFDIVRAFLRKDNLW